MHKLYGALNVLSGSRNVLVSIAGFVRASALQFPGHGLMHARPLRLIRCSFKLASWQVFSFHILLGVMTGQKLYDGSRS